MAYTLSSSTRSLTICRSRLNALGGLRRHEPPLQQARPCMPQKRKRDQEAQSGGVVREEVYRCSLIRSRRTAWRGAQTGNRAKVHMCMLLFTASCTSYDGESPCCGQLRHRFYSRGHDHSSSSGLTRKFMDFQGKREQERPCAC